MTLLDLLLLMVIKPLLVIALGVWHLQSTSQLSASFRHSLLFICLLLIPLLVISNLLLPNWQLNLHSTHPLLQLTIAEAWQLTWFKFTLAIYLVGCLWSLFYLGLGLFALSIRNRKQQQHEKLQQLCNRLRGLAQLKRKVTIHLDNQCRVPYVWGAIHPSLVLPSAAAQWPEHQQRLVMLHELGHVARWDWVCSLLVKFICALFWFLPFIARLNKTFTDMSERACDDWVIAQGEQSPDYAELLVTIDKGFKNQDDLPATFIDGKNGSAHYQRILALLDRLADHEPRTSGDWWRAISAGILWLIPLTLLHASVNLQTRPTNAVTFELAPAPINKTATTLTVNPTLWHKPIKPDNQQAPTMEEVWVSIEMRQAVFDTSDISTSSEHKLAVNPQVLIEGYLPVRTVLPHYPQRALKRNLEGKVIVQFTIDEQGHTQQPRIVASQPKGIFEKAVLTALKDFRFQPQLINGQPTSISGVTEEFVFQLYEADENPALKTRRRHSPVKGQTAIALQH
ncbi:hypothetical protein R50073_47010 [Maricurvus nonylphenolicus]|uniref:TonB family protein n=1 Tax=Maricurvus nonylphenolicus TaxID=1008307 RepID=UPI0036F229A2